MNVEKVLELLGNGIDVLISAIKSRTTTSLPH